LVREIAGPGALIDESTMAEILDHLQAGLDHHRAGRLAQAEKMYRRVLEVQPRHAGAMHLLGLVAFQIGKLDVAVQYVEKAVSCDPFHATYRTDLGEIHCAMAQIPQAMTAFRKALELDPKLAAAHARLGTLLESSGERDEALVCFQRALAIDPDNAEAHAAMGRVLQARGQWDQAQASLEKAAQLAPDNAEICLSLGKCLHSQQKLLDAIACYLQVIRLQGDSHAVHYRLGCAFQARGQLDRAVVHYSRAIELAPGLAEAHYNLGIVRRDQGRFEEAIKCLTSAAECPGEMVAAHMGLSNMHLLLDRPDEAAAWARRACQLSPQSAAAATCLARALHLQADLPGAIASFRRAVELDPDNAPVHSNLVYALHSDSAVDAATMWAEHRAWARRHAEPLTASAPRHRHDRAPERRLRIGYISPHFRDHSVSFFSLPLLAAHDHSAFEIFCYSDASVADDITARFQQSADQWRLTAGIPDEAVAERIREDQIDVLVDLAGHIGQNRLLVFARKPAPVQVTYLGYQDTTGMSAMDYRFTDAHADPPGLTEAFHSERLVRLPRTFFCYAPREQSPEVNRLPALGAGHVTFGWLNTTMKITPATVATWARILSDVPRSRLIVLAYRPGVFEQRVRQVMEDAGIEAARVEIVNWCSQDEYMRLHHRIDLALDSFPFCGHTTVCNALWMGVPSVMREGATFASRFGGSALVNLGLDDFIARSSEAYVRIAAHMAGDVPRLARLRAGLRKQMAESPLMGAESFARRVEYAYRHMWHLWCNR
jgi:predicted O-linked N-acetylglucosamine transferase (SPINDLY family)